MKNNKNTLLALIAATVVLPLLATSAKADLVYSLNQYSSSGYRPSESAPWGTFTFKQIAANQVNLTFQSNVSAGNGFSQLYFNVSKTLTSANITQLSGPSGWTNSVGAFSEDGYGKFTVRLQNSTTNLLFNINGTNSAVFSIIYTGISLADFSIKSTGSAVNGNAYVAGTLIERISGCDDTSYVSSFSPSIPEPSATLGLAALAGLGSLRLVRKAQKLAQIG